MNCSFICRSCLYEGRPAVESFTLLLSIVIIAMAEDVSRVRSEGGTVGPRSFVTGLTSHVLARIPFPFCACPMWEIAITILTG